MAQAGKNCDDQDYECPFCLEDFVNPVVLNCGHNLCLECAKRLAFRDTLAQKEDPAFAASCAGEASASSSSDAGSSSKSAIVATFGFDCPLCRKRTVLDEKGVEGLPPNIFLHNAVESQMKALSSIPQCSMCKEAESKWICQNCENAAFCEKCLEQHNTAVAAMPWLKGKHTIVAARAPGKVRPLQPCPLHPDETLKCYCVQDECLVCRDCLQFGSHNGHKSVLLKEAAALCNTKTQDLITSTSKVFSALDEVVEFESAEAELTKHYKDGVSQVNQAFDGLVKNIEAERSKLLASYTARKRPIASTAEVYRINKGAFEKLKQDVAANASSLADQQSHDDATSVYLDTLHLHKRLKALVKDVDDFARGECDTGRGGMWYDASKWCDALQAISAQVVNHSEKLASDPKPEVKPLQMASAKAGEQQIPESKVMGNILTASDDQTARIWNPATLQCVGTLNGHTHSVMSAMYSPDMKFIVTVSVDGTARIWNSATLECVGTLKGHTNAVWSAMYSPDMKFILTASYDKTARIWNSATLECVGTLNGHTHSVISAMYSPDMKFIVTASYDNTARIWNSTTLECVGTMHGHTNAVMSAMYSPDMKFILTASDNTARIWNSDTLECVGTLNGHTSYVYSAMYSPDMKFIVTASLDKTARIWNRATLECVGTLNGHTDGVFSAMYSPDMKFILTASGDRTARIWNSATLECVGTLNGHTGGLRKACF